MRVEGTILGEHQSLSYADGRGISKYAGHGALFMFQAPNHHGLEVIVDPDLIRRTIVPGQAEAVEASLRMLTDAAAQFMPVMNC